MKKSLIGATVAFGLALLALNSHAGQENSGKHMDNMKMEHAEMDSSQALGMNEGEVVEIDKANKSITLKHGPIKSKTVEMGAMTMPFFVQKASLLSGLKVGDKVKFNAENIKDMPTLTTLKKVKK